MSQLMTSVPERKMFALQTELSREVANRVISSNSIEAQRAEEVVVRGILPQQDLDAGGANDATYDGSGDAEWRQDYVTNGTADAFNEAYEVDSNSQADEKVLGFIGVQFEQDSPDERELRFLKGTSGTQGVKGWFNVETVDRDQEFTGVFTDSIIYGPTESGSIEFWLDAANDGVRTRLLGVTGEAVGETYSQPSNPLL